jgi:hypothetical protein
LANNSKKHPDTKSVPYLVAGPHFNSHSCKALFN